MKARIQFSLTALAVATLVGCGGGGGGGSDPKPVAESVTLTGTAATGAAMSGAAITAKCATGAGSATAGEDGAYTLKIDNGSLPCMIQAIKDDLTLHSVADGSGAGTKTANITPLTELVVAKVLGTTSTPGEAFGAFTANNKPDLSKLPEAKQTVAALIKQIAPEADFTNVDPFTTTFKAATATTQGDAFDQKLDKLLAAINDAQPDASNLTERIEKVANIIVTAPAGTGASEVIKEALAKPPVEQCSAARNVPYRIVNLTGDHGLAAKPDFANNNVQVAWNDNTSDSSKFEFVNGCELKITTSEEAVLTGAFAPSGIFAVQVPNQGSDQANIAVGIPEQKIPLADLAGKWNVVTFEFDDDNKKWKNSRALLTLNASGNATVADCTAATDSTKGCELDVNADGTAAKYTFTEHKDGGFLLVEPDNLEQRAFAFRSPSGALFMAISLAEGGIVLATKERTLSLPQAGDASSFWSISASFSSGKMVTALDFATTKVRSVDAEKKSVTRDRETLNGKADGRVDTVAFNEPRAGLRFRKSGSYTPEGGVQRPFADAISMPVDGSGLVVTIGAGGDKPTFLDLSVVKLK